MKKKMFSLTYCYEGVNGSSPFAMTLAVSEDKDKLVEYMEKCVAEDCRTPDTEDEEWDDDCNYSVWKRHDSEVYLQHNANNNLYTSYKINRVEIL